MYFVSYRKSNQTNTMNLLKRFEPGNKVLKTTISRCILCHKMVPAEVIRIGLPDGRGKIIMRRTCTDHRTKDFTIASDDRFYWLAQGNPENSKGGCGCGTACSTSSNGRDGTIGKNAIASEKDLGVIERLSTCLALIEIVDSCNLKCLTCFASSPHGVGSKLDYKSFENITSRINGVINRKGPIEIIQFSGGEPTLHPEFFQLVRWVISNPDIDVLLVNTNGIRLANDDEFISQMSEIMLLPDAVRKIQLYLQFDGPQIEGQYELRGADLRKVREKAIRNCEVIGLPITLAMTVTRQNLNSLWESTEYILPFTNIRGISFQPMFLSGRNPVALDEEPINVADIILGLNGQSGGKISVDDFTPLPCGDPNCATIGWLFRMDGKYHSPSVYGIDISKLQASLPDDRINYNLDDLSKCGCDNTLLGALMRQLENPIMHTVRLFIKPFMDARTWDQDRTDRCCTHVITPEGSLESFCKYYYGDKN
jgi:uncharacterized radical SAM superfamily Fe-S cluster-containing enzyme